MIRVGLLFGGANTEHEVSCNSAKGVLGALDRERYDVVLIGIDRGGRWHRVAAVDDLATANGGTALPDLDGLDVVLPILHGRFGEDGTVQGLLDLVGVPYVGCGVLASALAMDKQLTGTVLAAAGIPTIESVVISTETRPLAAELCGALAYPLFVKPNRSGSSVGASRVENAGQLDAALAGALEHDDLALVQPVVSGDEVDVGLLQSTDGSLAAGAVLRVKPGVASAFFDYAAKYTTGGATFEVPAHLPDAVTANLVKLAKRSFRALDCDGLARVDFFVQPDGAAVVNEVNTLPGMSALSQFPTMFRAAGTEFGAVLDTMIERALAVRSAKVLTQR